MAEQGTILIVDDQAAHLRAMTMLLAGLGYTALSAAGGAEALAVLEREPVDLIIADIAMPQINGYQLLERIRARPEWARIPFVFLTARALDSDIRYGKTLGADDYLTKPVQAEDLLATVEGKLRRRARLLAGDEAPPGQIVAGALRIDPARHHAWLGATPLTLSAREFAVLATLARRPLQLVGLAELLQATHGLTASPDEASELLRPLVRGLRRKLGYGPGESGCIETVRGLGYRLTPP